MGILSAKPVLIGLHLMSAIVAIDAFLWLLSELRNKNNTVWARRWPALVGILGFVFSWIVGGYYYVVYYGPLVKPVIKQGAADWAHAVAMESKEHLFLFLLPVAVTVYLTAGLSDKQLDSSGLRQPVMWLTASLAGLGLFIGLAGFVISSAARWG